MRKHIQLTHVLFSFDGPQVIEGRDPIGGHYIAALTGNENGANEYLVVGTSPTLLRQFKIGSIDLKELVLACGDTSWFLGKDDEEAPNTVVLEPQDTPIAKSSLLPSEGFHLHEREAEGSCLREARSQNNLVIEISSEPPESEFEHRISVRALSELLLHFQRLVSHAFSSGKKSPISSRECNDLSTLDVIVPAAAGSFRVVLEPKITLDLLGNSELTSAVNLVESTLSKCGSYDETLEKMKSHQGHFAKAYIDLLGFIAENDTSFRMSWAEPNFHTEKTRNISATEAKRLHLELKKNSELSNQVVEFEGQLIKANTQNKTWGIKVDDGKILSGKCAKNGPSLSGLTLESLYKFKCIENITFNPATGKEQATLILVEFEAV